MIRTAQSLGAHVTPINGRLWDPSADSYRPDRGYEASCRKRDGIALHGDLSHVEGPQHGNVPLDRHLA